MLRYSTTLQPIAPRPSAPVAAQPYSIDYLVRLRRAELLRLEWEHIETFLTDPRSLDGACLLTRPLQGSTEWIARHAGPLLSLAWDWVVTDDMTMTSCATVHPRTNIVMIDDTGYDMDSAATHAELWSAIAQTPWQNRVRAFLKHVRRTATR